MHLVLRVRFGVCTHMRFVPGILLLCQFLETVCRLFVDQLKGYIFETE